MTDVPIREDRGKFPCGCVYPYAQIVEDLPQKKLREFFCITHGTYYRALRGTPLFLVRQHILSEIERQMILSHCTLSSHEENN